MDIFDVFQFVNELLIRLNIVASLLVLLLHNISLMYCLLKSMSVELNSLGNRSLSTSISVSCLYRLLMLCNYVLPLILNSFFGLSSFSISEGTGISA